MASRPRIRMDSAERAKQFMPFSALKGLQEALAQRERIPVSKMELSEDMAAELDRKLQRVERGTMVTATFFQQGEYRRLAGVVIRMDKNGRMLQLEDKRIKFTDIMDIEVVDSQ